MDATIDDGTLGRLVNDEDKKSNAVVVLEVEGCPHICLFAAEVLEPDVEIRYNTARGLITPGERMEHRPQTPLEDETGLGRYSESFSSTNWCSSAYENTTEALEIASTTTVNLTKEERDTIKVKPPSRHTIAIYGKQK